MTRSSATRTSSRTQLRAPSRVSSRPNEVELAGDRRLELVLPGRAGVQPVLAVRPLVDPDLQPGGLRLGAGLDRGGELHRPLGVGARVRQEQ